jgi:hypothetical protein
MDGVIRAAGGHSVQALAKDLLHADLFTHFSKQSSGSYYTQLVMLAYLPTLFIIIFIVMSL